MKATYVEVKHSTESGSPAFAVEGREIFKDPITDDGTKKSATGLLSVVYDDNNEYKLIDKVDWETTNDGALQTIYKDGKQYNVTTLDEIRKRMK
jgi:nicotinamide phosphoribosyltransferase